MNAIKIKHFGLGGEEIFQAHYPGHIRWRRYCEAGRCSGQEEMIFRRFKACAVRWVYEPIIAQLIQFLAGHVCEVRSGVVLKEADEAVVWALALNLTDKKIQLLPVKLCSEAGAGCQKFKQKHNLAVPQIDSMTFFGWNPGLTVVFGCLLTGPHDPTGLILAYTPLPHSSEIGVEEDVMHLTESSPQTSF